MTDTEIIELTPQVAAEFLQRNGANRKIRRTNVDRIARDIIEGRWKFDGVAITFDDDGIMRSGQHRCMAVVQAGQKNPDVHVTVLVVRGVDPDSTLTANAGVPTSGGDVLAMEGYSDSITLASTARLHFGYVTGVISTVSSYMGGDVTLTSQELLAHVKEFPELIPAVGHAHQMSRGLDGYPRTALAVFAHEVKQVDLEAAALFFHLVGDRVRKGVGDPLTAMDMKGTQALRARRGSHSSMSQASALYFAFRTWNAWRKDETLSTLLIRSNDSKIPTPK